MALALALLRIHPKPLETAGSVSMETPCPLRTASEDQKGEGSRGESMATRLQSLLAEFESSLTIGQTLAFPTLLSRGRLGVLVTPWWASLQPVIREGETLVPETEAAAFYNNVISK